MYYGFSGFDFNEYFRKQAEHYTNAGKNAKEVLFEIYEEGGEVYKTTLKKYYEGTAPIYFQTTDLVEDEKLGWWIDVLSYNERYEEAGICAAKLAKL